MNENVLQFLSSVFLFRGVNTKTVEEILEDIDVKILDFSKNDFVFSSTEAMVGFIVEGECLVNKTRHDGGCVSINRLQKHDSFGILSVLSENTEFPTAIIAAKQSRVLFIKKDDVERIVDKYPKIAKNLINFLTEKIIFLNERITTYSGGTVEEKLASYLLSIYRKTKSVEIKLNKKRSAEVIGCGRASLYRAISELEKQNYILIKDDKIILKDPTGLERYSK